MRTKYIIVAVLAGVGVLFGVWNWMNYFSQQNAGPRPQIQAVRPPPKQDIVEIENQMQQAAAEQSAKQEQGTAEEREREKIDLPDTVGRNPFLSPEEIRMIASGEMVEEQTPAAPGTRPDLTVSALLQDNASGDYVALIGGKAYREGEMIGSEQVVEITSSSVVLEQAGQRRTIGLAGKNSRSGVTIEMRNN